MNKNNDNNNLDDLPDIDLSDRTPGKDPFDIFSSGKNKPLEPSRPGDKKEGKSPPPLKGNKKTFSSDDNIPPPPPMRKKTFSSKPKPKTPKTDEKVKKAIPIEKKMEKVLWFFLLASALFSAVMVITRFVKSPDAEQESVREELKKLAQMQKEPSKTRETVQGWSSEVTSFKIDIVGSEKFVKSVNEALKLIIIYNKPAIRDLREHIYVIREGLKTDFVIEANVPKIILTTNTALRSVTWCAGAIAHQLYLAKVHYWQEMKSKVAKVPLPGKKSGLRVRANPAAATHITSAEIERLEKAADRYQVNLMVKIGAPIYEIRLIAKRKAGDYSLTHDGLY
ncbi:MAG TPA: hypothetical protein VMW66_04035 [Elusimicrobiales bacterium]|nr:hypothetical protein [Elusimicrobiales bacterium]